MANKSVQADAILSSVASKLGVSKTDILDPTSSDAAVKQAHAETNVIQETKAYLSSNGIDLEAFKIRERDDKIVLLKNFPFGTKAEELRTLLTEYGPLSRFLMPPAGTIAIAEFQAASTARAAFTGLAYRRFKDGILFLEKGPKGLFSGKISTTTLSLFPGILLSAGKDVKPSASDLKDTTTAQTTDDNDITTLFVRNLSFSTTSDGFTAAFSHIPGFLWAKIKLKPDPKREGGTLSMGFGFVGFSTPEQARNAIAAMDGHTLDGHKLLIKVAHRTNNDDRRKSKKIKEDAKRTKIIIKNLPFEVTKKDVRSLFGYNFFFHLFSNSIPTSNLFFKKKNFCLFLLTGDIYRKYGTLRTVRMPKKLGNHTRGFAFAEFVTAKEAANAIEALKDTHLLGRRLVLDYANQNSQDAEEEIERMSKKVSEQANIVAVARLKEKSKSKVVLDETGAVDMD
jgi:multiple RNA-binding domain-containing protein 1